MQNPRDQGHALLHRLCLLALIFVWFWISLDLWEGWDLSLITLPWNYAMVAMAGLLVATFGSLQNYGAFYIKNGWQRVRESFNKANFQSSLIAFFVFASYFATKDNETSRLFLAFYIVQVADWSRVDVQKSPGSLPADSDWLDQAVKVLVFLLV